MEDLDAVTHEGWKQVEAVLPPDWRELAETNGVRPSGEAPSQLGGKITDVGQLLRMFLHHAITGQSLKVTTAIAAASGLAAISHVALHLRLRQAEHWLAAMLVRTMGMPLFEAERWGGYEIVACDGSAVAVPGAKGTSAMILYAVRLNDMRVLQVDVGDHKLGESFSRFDAYEGQLWLADRAYGTARGIAQMSRDGAHVLVRFSPESLPLFDGAERRIDVAALRAKAVTPGKAIGRRAAVVGPDGVAVHGRICVMALNPAQYAKALDRLRREVGTRSITAAMRENARYVLLFTTAPPERLTAQQAVDLYCARWQVELQIKRDKSLGGLSRVPTQRRDTTRAWLLANLLAQQLATRLGRDPAELSPLGDRRTAAGAGIDASAETAQSPRLRPQAMADDGHDAPLDPKRAAADAAPARTVARARQRGPRRSPPG